MPPSTSPVVLGILAIIAMAIYGITEVSGHWSREIATNMNKNLLSTEYCKIPSEILVVPDNGYYALPFQMGNAGLQTMTTLRFVMDDAIRYQIEFQDCFCAGDMLRDLVHTEVTFNPGNGDIFCQNYSEELLFCQANPAIWSSAIYTTVGPISEPYRPTILSAPYGGGTYFVAAFLSCGVGNRCCDSTASCNYTIANPEILLSSSSSCSSSSSKSCPAKHVKPCFAKSSDSCSSSY